MAAAAGSMTATSRKPGAVPLRSNLDRLAEVKRAYDPRNLFRVNRNVAPAATAAARVIR